MTVLVMGPPNAGLIGHVGLDNRLLVGPPGIDADSDPGTVNGIILLPFRIICFRGVMRPARSMGPLIWGLLNSNSPEERQSAAMRHIDVSS